MKDESRQIYDRRMRWYNKTLRDCRKGKNREKVAFEEKMAENFLVVIIKSKTKNFKGENWVLIG